MLKSKAFLYLLLALACMAGPVAARGSAATTESCAPSMVCMPPSMPAQKLKAILEGALAEWPQPHNCTYGTFRSAYNHGTLTIEAHASITNAYNVRFDGILVCVQLPI